MFMITRHLRLFSILLILAILTCCTKFPDLGSGYRFVDDGKYTLAIVNFQNDVIVNSHILEYAFDSDNIIVSQRPWDSVPNIRKMNFTNSQVAFEKSTFRQYWIINKKEKCEFNGGTKSYSNVYGPFKKNEYFKWREEMKIPRELRLTEK